jgi:hypothetical protein
LAVTILRYRTPQTQAGFMLPIAGEPAIGPTLLRVAYDGQRFQIGSAAVPPGPIVFEIENTGSRRASLLLINWPPAVVAQTVKSPLEFEPFLSGGMLLTRQTFRRLFRSERVEESEGLGVRQVTLLFTDLKGSTAMYERLGDLNAYALVRQHFALVGDAVQARAGAVVKTIGDAAMAAFFRPTDAVAAALRMLIRSGGRPTSSWPAFSKAQAFSRCSNRRKRAFLRRATCPIQRRSNPCGCLARTAPQHSCRMPGVRKRVGKDKQGRSV